MEIVRLRNGTDKQFSDVYGSVPYICPPGDAILVPTEAVWLWFGNPNLQDRPVLSQYDRRDEYQRVFTRNGFDKLSAAGIPFDLPSYTLETLEGEKYWTVLEDPEGVKMTSSGIAARGLDNTEAIANELEVLKKNQAALLARLEELQLSPQEATLDDIPDDSPVKVPVGPKGA